MLFQETIDTVVAVVIIIKEEGVVVDIRLSPSRKLLDSAKCCNSVHSAACRCDRELLFRVKLFIMHTLVYNSPQRQVFLNVYNFSG